jgi:hypothetical protein
MKDVPAVETPPSVNYPLVGFGILRIPGANQNEVNLIMSYGPSASHGHPDKLHLDLYAYNDVLMPSPGIDFPYFDNSRIPMWYHTTLSHNTLTVDEKSQNFHEHSNRLPDVRADQLVFGPAQTMGLERAWTETAYPGVVLDRSVFLTSHYLADIFGTFSRERHKYDLAWHIRGELSSSLRFDPSPFSEPIPNGYNSLVDVRQAKPTSASWSVTLASNGHIARLIAAGGPLTQPITGQGGFYVDWTSTAPHRRPQAATILERRDNANSTVFGNVLDLSDKADGFVKDVTQEGGLDSGYSLLKVETTDGTDLCFAAYHPGRYQAAGLETDALQAFVQTGGQGKQALYLGGGMELRTGDASITRSEPGLAYIEQSADGGYIVGNPSPTGAEVSVMMPQLTRLKAFNVDDEGKITDRAQVKMLSNAMVSVHLEAAARVEFTPTGQGK